MQNYYEKLGVSKTATSEEIAKAYKRLSRELHPDCTGGDKEKEERFKAIALAYSVLKDPELRAVYDRKEGSDLTSEELKRIDDAMREFYRNFINGDRVGAFEALENLAADPVIVRQAKEFAFSSWRKLKNKILEGKKA